MASFLCYVCLRLAQIASSASILGLSIHARATMKNEATYHSEVPYLLCDYGKFFIFIGVFVLLYTTVTLIMDLLCYVTHHSPRSKWPILTVYMRILSLSPQGRSLALDIADFSSFLLSLLACASLSAELARGLDPLSSKFQGRSPISKALIALSCFLACVSLLAGLSSHPRNQRPSTVATGNTSLSSDYHFSTSETAIDHIIDAVKN